MKYRQTRNGKLQIASCEAFPPLCHDFTLGPVMVPLGPLMMSLAPLHPRDIINVPRGIIKGPRVKSCHSAKESFPQAAIYSYAVSGFTVLTIFLGSGESERTISPAGKMNPKVCFFVNTFFNLYVSERSPSSKKGQWLNQKRQITNCNLCNL